jgi:hypothetical protein
LNPSPILIPNPTRQMQILTPPSQIRTPTPTVHVIADGVRAVVAVRVPYHLDRHRRHRWAQVLLAHW